jgi:hypothetical protein
MADPKVFDDVTRTDARPSRHVESRFGFYNRAAGPVFDRIRNSLDSWFRAYPADGQPDLRARLRSSADDAFSGAFWELYQHQTLTLMGYSVESHPKLAGTTRRPDFLVARPGDRGFYLEATIASPSRDERGSDRILGTIFDLLNELSTPNFFLEVEVKRRGPLPPSTKQVRRDLTAWLAALDPDEIERAPGGWLRHAPFSWEMAGWSIQFRPIPKSPGYRGKPSRAIGVNIDAPVRVVDTSSGLRDAIKGKAGRYGTLDRPYVIAVLIEDRYMDREAVVAALYGTVSYLFDSSPNATFDPRPFRQLDGPWMSPTGPTNTRVSAVLTAINLSPPLVTRIAPHVWHNPWAARPLVDRMNWATSRVEDGVLVDADAELPLHELLALPPEWPGPEDPFPHD